MLSIRAAYFGLPVLHAPFICKLRLCAQGEMPGCLPRCAVPRERPGGRNGRALPEEEGRARHWRASLPIGYPRGMRIRWRVAYRGCIPGSGEIWRRPARRRSGRARLCTQICFTAPTRLGRKPRVGSDPAGLTPGHNASTFFHANRRRIAVSPARAGGDAARMLRGRAMGSDPQGLTPNFLARA
jgi:hypothetical protein